MIFPWLYGLHQFGAGHFFAFAKKTANLIGQRLLSITTTGAGE